MDQNSQEMLGKVAMNRQGGGLQSCAAKARLKWTRALHERFLEAVARLGGADKATPKSVMRMMGVPGLTLHHLKSHLQKYRLAKSRVVDVRRNVDDRVPDYHLNVSTSPEREGDVFISSGCSRLGSRADPDRGDAEMELSSNSTEINRDMLQKQMEVQRQLQEQIQVQKHLQLRIEAQGKYLQSVMKKAEETLAAYHHNFATIQGSKSNLGFENGKDHSGESCLTTSEKYEMKNHDNSEENNSLQATTTTTTITYVASDRRSKAKEQKSLESWEEEEELFDLNRLQQYLFY